MNIPLKYEDVVAKLDAAQTEIKCLKAVLNGMEFKQVDDMVLDGVDACLFLGQESARIIKGIQAERNGLREELERTKKAYEAYGIDFDRSEEKEEALQHRLTVAEQQSREMSVAISSVIKAAVFHRGVVEIDTNAYHALEDALKPAAEGEGS